MKIALLSLDIVSGDKDANILAVRQSLDCLQPDTDLVLLPELFSTGFVSKAEWIGAMAENNDGAAMTAVHDMAVSHNVAIAGSFLAKNGDKASNRGFFIEPSGDEMFFDKRHLFSMSSESKLLQRGNDHIAIVRFRGWNIALAVCYDLRFPVWCRNRRSAYDVMAVVANWPESRKYAWSQLIKARGIENQAYVVAVNRSGEDKFGRYGGMDMAVDCQGKELALQYAHDLSPAPLAYVSLDMDSLLRWREEFSVWRDADDFTVEF